MAVICLHGLFRTEPVHVPGYGPPFTVTWAQRADMLGPEVMEREMAPMDWGVP